MENGDLTDGFAARLLDAHAQRDHTALVEIVAGVGVVRVVRWLRASSCADGPAIVATLAQLQPAWRRALERAGAVSVLVASIKMPQKREREDGRSDDRVAALAQQLKKSKTSDDDDDVKKDQTLLVDALRWLSPAMASRIESTVDAAVVAYVDGTWATKRAVLLLLSDLSAKPLTRPTMLKAGVVALCVDALEHFDKSDSWQLALTILTQLSVNTLLPFVDAEDASETDEEEDSDFESEEENPAANDELVSMALLGHAQGEVVDAVGGPRSLDRCFEIAPGSCLSKLKTLKQLVARNTSVKRAVGRLIPRLVEVVVHGDEHEQLMAARTVVALIDRCPSNAVSVVRSNGAHAFVRLSQTHMDVVAVVNELERFVRRLNVIRSDETRDAVCSIFKALLNAAQNVDTSNGEGAVAIELVSLLSATRSLLAALVEAGAVRVISETLRQMTEADTSAGAIQLRHISVLLSSMAKSSTYGCDLVEQGVLKNLITLLKRAPPGTRSGLTAALANFAVYPPAKRVLGSSGCLDLFVSMLFSVVERESTAAADALAAACLGCAENVAMLRTAEVVHQCVEWLRAKSDATYEPALRLLAILTAHHDFLTSVVSHKIASLIVAALRHGSSKAKVYAASLTGALARDPKSCLELTRLGAPALLKLVASDSSASAVVDAAQRALAEQSFNTSTYWVERVSRESGKMFYYNALSGEIQWQQPASANPIDNTRLGDVDTDVIAHIRLAGGIQPLLKILGASDRRGTMGDGIVSLLHQLALANESSKLEIVIDKKAFVRLLWSESQVEQDVTTDAIVGIADAVTWLEDERTRITVVESVLHQFTTAEPRSVAVTLATRFVTRLRGLDSIEADATLAAFFHGLLEYAKSNVNMHATLVVQLLLPWCELPQLAHAFASAGTAAFCESMFERTTRENPTPRCGAFGSVHVQQLAKAMVANGAGEKLVEEGIVEVLVGLFEALHQAPAHVGTEHSGGDSGENWIAQESRSSGRVYYYSDRTGETRWQKPVAPFSASPRVNQLISITEVLFKLAWKIPHARTAIGASASCIATLVAAINPSASDSIVTASSANAQRCHYVNVLAAACLDCPETVLQVPVAALLDRCVEILKQDAVVEEASSALRLIYSLAKDPNAGPHIAANTELVDAVLDALRSESQEKRHSKSTKWQAARAVGVLVRYAPSRTRLEEAGVEDLLKPHTRHSKVKKALQALHFQQRLAAMLARKAVENETEGFYMVDADDMIASEMDQQLTLMIATLDNAGSDQARVDAVKAVLAFINGSDRRAIVAVRSGLVDSIIRVFSTTAITSKTAKSAIQKTLRELHNINDRSDVTKEAEAELLRSMFAFALTSRTERGRLAVSLLSWWATKRTFQRAFDASDVGAASVAWIRAALATDADEQPDNEGVQMNDVLTLLSWLVFSASVREQLTSNGIVPLLLTILFQQPRGERTKNLAIVHTLARNDASVRPQLTPHLDAFVAIMRSGTSRERDSATNLIAAACTDCPENVARVPHAELLDRCMNMLDNGLGASQQAALRLIKSLSADAVVGPVVVAHTELVDLVYTRLQRTPASTRKLATDALVTLTQCGLTNLILEATEEEAMLEDSMSRSKSCRPRADSWVH